MTEFKNVDEAITFLHQLPRLQRKNDLTYVKKVLQAFGNPERMMKTIHLTGTNGKGSTSYYLNSLLQRAGLTTGLFVSPFINQFNERIQINGENIADDDLIGLVTNVKEKVAQIKEGEPEFILTEFEYLVVMAFVYFAEQKVEYAVIEAGIGARHDKTNVIIPEVSIITSVGMDHEQLIGPTIEGIAQEKSGVIKKQVPLILGDITTVPLQIIRDEAKELSAPIFQLFHQFEMVEKDNHFQVRLANGRKFEFLRRPLVEEYDIAMAIQAFDLLDVKLEPNGVSSAINQTNTPGRYQFLQDEPTIIVDGAHNVQAVKELIKFTKHINHDAGKIYYLVAIMKDKDIADFLNLLPRDNTILTTIQYDRAAKVKDFIADLGYRPTFIEDFTEAYQYLSAKVGKNDIIVVTGSFYFVTDFLNYYNSL